LPYRTFILMLTRGAKYIPVLGVTLTVISVLYKYC
jgi:hypothetical protein